MASSTRNTHETNRQPERLSNTAATMCQHQLGSLTFNSASKQDLVNTIERWMIGQQAHGSVEATNRIPDVPGKQEINAIPDVKHSGFSIGYINPHVYNLSQIHDQVHEFLSNCNLVCIDGLGTSLALRAGYGIIDRPPVHRVVALNLFDALLDRLSIPSSAILIGVNKGDVEKSAANINKLNSAFSIVDVMDGFGSDAQYKQFLSSHRQIQWVLIGAGTPKSESIALLARIHCPDAIVFHMGAGTIKVYAGSKRRAPQWISDYGFEWVHRMIFEPHTRERYTRGVWQFLNHLITRKRTATKKKADRQP